MTARKPDNATPTGRYKFIHFVRVIEMGKTAIWACRNNEGGAELGMVEWYPAWKQYCYFPTVQAVYSAGCLKDIQDFIGSLK